MMRSDSSAYELPEAEKRDLDGAEVLERGKRTMEFLKRVVRGRLAESLDEEVRVEDVLVDGRRH